MYHSIAKVGSDPWYLSVTPQHFAEQMEVLRKQARPQRLRELAQSIKDGKISSGRTTVVTFDDGYANNFHNALPVLERYDVPATFFVTAGFIGKEREFWWDELDRLLLQPGVLPKTLQLKISGRVWRWELEEGHYSEDAYRSQLQWRAWGKDRANGRHSLYQPLYELLQPLLEEERRAALDEIVAWAGTAFEARETHRPLKIEELHASGESDLIEIGAHSMTHPVLSRLPVTTQRAEIEQSKTLLEEIMNRQVSSFAYPFGKPSHYTSETVALVREAGFTCACSNSAGLIKKTSDLLQLPRFYVQDWDGEEFAEHLADWFQG